MPWKDEPGFFYTWLALIALLALGAVGIGPIFRNLFYVLTILYVPPAVAAVACLLGILTYSVTPFSWLRCRPPYNLVMLAVSAIWCLCCALLASSRRPWDLRALPAYPILFLTWR
ncbi:MAG: hypothetical protein QI223_09755 [Candidatus Korarchaeota archaeon]|nr:hypothetical protein [Candidatus Korarchaeota archaeon]